MLSINKKNKPRERDYFLIIILVFRITLDWSYHILNNLHSIEFSLSFNIYKYLFSYFILIIISLATYKSKSIISFFIRILIFFTITPVTSVYGLRDESNIFFILTTLSFFLVELIVFKKYKHSNCSQTSDKTLSTEYFTSKKSILVIILSVSIAIATFFMMYLGNGTPNLTTLILTNVYEVRENVNVSKYLSYLLFLTTQVLIPFGIAVGISNKKYILVIGCIIFQFCFFLWTGHKAWLFLIFLLLFLIAIIKLNKSLNSFFAIITLLCLLTCVFWENNVGKTLFSLINRRVMLDPAALKFFYYDYFVVKDNVTVGLGGTLLAPFLGSNLSPEISNYTYIISALYTDAPSNAGTGLYGGDVANFGILAFVFVPIALIFLAKLIDHANQFYGRTFVLTFFSYIVLSFNDQRIVAYFLDFRGLFLIYIVYFYAINMRRPLEKIEEINVHI